MARDRDLTVDAPAVRDAAAGGGRDAQAGTGDSLVADRDQDQSDRARDGLDAMVADVEAKLLRIDSLVAEAEAE